MFFGINRACTCFIALALAGAIMACGGSDKPTVAEVPPAPEVKTTAAATTPTAIPPSPTPAPPKINARFEAAGLVDGFGGQSASYGPASFLTSGVLTAATTPVVKLTADSERDIVLYAWKYQDAVIRSGTTFVSKDGWSELGRLYVSTGYFPAGDYKLDLSLGGTSETRVLTYTNGKAPLQQATLLDAGLVDFRTATSKASADLPGQYGTEFPSSDSTSLNVVYKLSGADTWLTATVEFQGRTVYSSTLVQRAGALNQTIALNQFYSPPAGDYVLKLTPAGGASKTLPFRIVDSKAVSLAKPQLGKAGIIEGLDVFGRGAKCPIADSLFSTKMSVSSVIAFEVPGSYTAASQANAWVKTTLTWRNIEIPSGLPYLYSSLVLDHYSGDWYAVLTGGENADYGATVSLLGGESRSMSFSVVDPSDPSLAKPVFGATGFMSDWDGCSPPSSTPGTNAPVPAPQKNALEVIFSLTGAGGQVSIVWKKDGQVIDFTEGGKTRTQTVGRGIPSATRYTTNSKGSYEVTLSIPVTGETRVVTFTVS